MRPGYAYTLICILPLLEICLSHSSLRTYLQLQYLWLTVPRSTNNSPITSENRLWYRVPLNEGYPTSATLPPYMSRWLRSLSTPGEILQPNLKQVSHPPTIREGRRFKKFMIVNSILRKISNVIFQKVFHRSNMFRFNLCSSVALYHTICTCTLRTYTYICYMAYRTLDPRYTLPYIPIRVLHHTKLLTLFTISSHHCHLAC